MAQHINKDDLRQIIKKMIKESVGIPSEENYYISVMVPRIKSWMDEVYQDWGGIDAVSPEALTDFSNRNDYEDSLETFAHEFNVDREELRPVFDKAIEIAHSQLKEDLLGEAKFVNQFTPYTDDEKRTNFEYLRTGFGRSPEERNPSYAAAKKAAEERRKQKEAQKQNGEVSETIRYGAERMAADNNYRMRWNEKYLQPLLDKCDAILNGSENASVQEIVDLYKRLNTIKSSNPIRYDVRLIELQDEIKDRLEKLVEFIRQMMTNRPNESKKRIKKSEIVEAIKDVVNNQTLNCNRNMTKKLIRLKESDLHRIVKESVNRILNEEYVWWGDTKPVETIMMAANQIRTKFEKDYPEDYEFDVDDRAKLDLYNWAKQVEDRAEDFIRYNAHNVSINGGEDW